MAPRDRHKAILRAFDALPEGRALLVVTDHEAHPLHVELERGRSGTYAWAQRKIGDQRWEVVLRRVVPGVDGTVSDIERCMAFWCVSATTKAALASSARRASIRRGRAVAEQGILWPYLGLVKSGSVQAVLATDNGREQVLFDALPGDVFGEAALIDGGPTVTRYIAQAAGTVVLLFPAIVVHKCFATDPVLFRALAELSVQRARAYLDRFALLLAQPALARIATVLLPYAPPMDGLAPALEPLPTMTQPEIARLAGTVKEIVQRLFPKLEAENAIRRVGGRIVQVNRAELLRLASPGQHDESRR